MTKFEKKKLDIWYTLTRRDEITVRAHDAFCPFTKA